MENKPSRLLSDSQIAANFIRANPVFAVDEHPKSRKPFVERDCAILKDRSNLDGELLVTLFTLPAKLRCKVVVLFVSALRAGRTIRPTESGNRVNADLFIAEVPNRLLECFGLHGLFPLPKYSHYSLWLVKYIIAFGSVDSKGVYIAPKLCKTRE